MKILYDLASFLPIYLESSKSARTGVYRYVQHLALGLIGSPDAEMTFCSSRRTEREEEWLTHYKHLRDIGACPYIKQEKPKFLFEKVSQLKDTINQSRYAKSPFVKTGRELLCILEKWAKPLPLDCSKAHHWDIFFSAYHPIPRQLKSSSSLKLFVTIHDLIYKRYPQYFSVDKRSFFKHLIQKKTKDQFFFCVSQSTKDDLCSFYSIDENRIFIVHSAVADGYFYPCRDKEKYQVVRKKYNLPQEGQYFLSLSTLEPRKNIPHLIRSFAGLVLENKMNDLYLVLTGPRGWQYEEIFATIKNFSLIKNKVIFTDFVEDMDLATLYSNALAFVFPSLYEGFGLPPLEAMTCGVPVIASNLSSLPEVIGSAGLLIDPIDQDLLSQSMFDLYHNKDLRLTLIEKSLRQSKKFNWANNTKQAIKAFQSVL